MTLAKRIEFDSIAITGRVKSVAIRVVRARSPTTNIETPPKSSGPVGRDDRSQASRRSHFLHQGLPKRSELLAIGFVVLVAAFRLHATVDPDVSWQLWIAKRLHHGARLYRDIIEVNPPLWFWLAVPIDRIATFIGVRSDAVMIIAVAAAVIASLITTTPLLGEVAQRARAQFLAYAAAILFVMPWMHIGQREQLVLIGALPYAALIAERHSKRQVSFWLATAIGTGAAIGFALKHYFLIVPFLLELWLFFTSYKSWRLLRPEIVAAGAVGIGYCAAIFIFTPDYFTTVLPLIREAYGATGATRFVDVLQPPVWIAVFTIFFIAVHAYRQTARISALTMALLIASVGFGVAYFIQHKGWLYHSIPFVGCASLALAALLADRPTAPATLRILGPVLLALPLVVTLQEWRSNALPGPELIRSIADLSPGDGVGFIATEPALAWSVILQHQLRYASRYYGFWMVRAILQNEHKPRPDPKLEKLRADVIHQTVVDFQCIAPRRIIVARPPYNSTNRGNFDILSFFLKDRQFSAMLAHYRPVERGETLEIYNLVVPFDRPSLCRRGV